MLFERLLYSIDWCIQLKQICEGILAQRGNQGNSSQLFFRRLGQLMLIIVAGTIAYGFGLYRGHQFRMNKDLANHQLTEATQSSMAKEMSFMGPMKPNSFSREPANNRGNTQNPKSHSK